MAEFSQLVALLHHALAEPGDLPADVQTFQQTVWNDKETILNEHVDGIIRTLAYDLDYYEADPVSREENSSFFGEGEALDLIRSALAAIQPI